MRLHTERAGKVFVGLDMLAGCVAQNGRGYLTTGQLVDAANPTNNKLRNTVITAATRDRSAAAVNFGMGAWTGGTDVNKA